MLVGAPADAPVERSLGVLVVLIVKMLLHNVLERIVPPVRRRRNARANLRGAWSLAWRASA